MQVGSGVAVTAIEMQAHTFSIIKCEVYFIFWLPAAVLLSAVVASHTCTALTQMSKLHYSGHNRRREEAQDVF